MRIIPAIDMIDGKCVRLSQGDYSKQTTYGDDVLEMAKRFEGAGIQYLHLVDLDGARSKHVVNWKQLERVTHGTSLQVDFGGGVKTDKDLQIVFECGAQQVTAGSIAVTNPDLVSSWLATYGAEKIILGADAKDGQIATHGWEQSSGIDLREYVSQWIEAGARQVICTDIAKDGMLAGPSTNLYKELTQENPNLQLIASGGVTTLDDLEQLREIGCEGAIVGKAIYEGTIQLEDLSKML